MYNISQNSQIYTSEFQYFKELLYHFPQDYVHFICSNGKETTESAVKSSLLVHQVYKVI